MRDVVVRTKEEFIQTIHTVILEHKLSLISSPSTLKRIALKDAKRLLWCAPTAASGRAAVCFIRWAGYRYRLHANTHRTVMEGFLRELENDELDGVTPTKNTGTRVDIVGSSTVRTNLYLYREAYP